MFTWFFLLASLIPAADGPPRLRIEPDKSGKRIAVTGALPSGFSAKHHPGKLTQEQGEQLLRFHRFVDGKETAAIFGTYVLGQTELRFTPRYPLEAGGNYRVRMGESTLEYHVPLPPPAPAAVVEKVYPSGDILPANHLRFYFYFSRPMRGGPEVFDQIQILDAQGYPVNAPWLRDELWDETGQRLILYIHPGRIKWDLFLRLTLGAVLLPERAYTLVVRQDMLDADGRRLGREYRKKFRTTAQDRVRIDTGAWALKPPAADTIQALVLKFDKPLDHASLQRFLTVSDARGNAVRGTIRVGEEERSWSFEPAAKWRAEEHVVKIDPRLEDPSGNTPDRPFDVDRRTPVPRRPPVLELRFRPR
jgi:hypothetical protein